MIEPHTPFEPPRADRVPHFLLGEHREWLPGHRERYRFVEESREHACRIVPDGEHRYMVCLHTPPNTWRDWPLQRFQAAVSAVRIAHESYSSALGRAGAPLVWEIVGPLLDAVLELQSLSWPDAVVVGVDTHTGRLFAHPLPEFMAYILWRAVQETGRVPPLLLRRAMGFERHLAPGERPRPGVVYRVQGDLVARIHRVYPSWAEAAAHNYSLFIADETARRLPHALRAVARIVNRTVPSFVRPLSPGETRNVVVRSTFRCPLDEALEVEVDVSASGLGLRYSRATRYYLQAGAWSLGPTYTVLGACDPLEEECGGPEAVAARLATLVLSEALGGANAVFPEQAVIDVAGGDSLIIFSGPILAEASFKAAYAASLYQARRREAPTSIEVSVGNHAVRGEGLPLATWLLGMYSKMLRIVSTALRAGSRTLDMLSAMATILSTMITGDVTLTVKDRLTFEHEEHGTITLETGPALVTLSTLAHPTTERRGG